MRFVKPLDENLLHEICQKFDTIITIEDGCVKGGFGSAILEFIAENLYSINVKILGIPDRFINHGTQEELYNECYYNTEAIIKTVNDILKKKSISHAV